MGVAEYLQEFREAVGGEAGAGLVGVHVVIQVRIVDVFASRHPSRDVGNRAIRFVMDLFIISVGLGVNVRGYRWLPLSVWCLRSCFDEEPRPGRAWGDFIIVVPASSCGRSARTGSCGAGATVGQVSEKGWRQDFANV